MEMQRKKKTRKVSTSTYIERAHHIGMEAVKQATGVSSAATVRRGIELVLRAHRLWPPTLVAMRIANGLSQARLARALDVSPGALANWESGESVPDAEMLIRWRDTIENAS